MDRKKLIRAYLEFFKSKNHREIANFSLIPENSEVLYTTAGMHPLVPYLLGQKHPLGNRLCNVQKCLRTDDIDKVGDFFHHTFFEMLGNWSLGDYWKEDAIKYSFEFLTKVLKIPKEKLAVSCFKGDKNLKVRRDEESAKIWTSLGIPKKRIKFLGKKDNWWSAENGPCGPDTEIFFWASNEKAPRIFDSKDKRWVEIWNDVFMQYEKIEVDTILVDAINVLIHREKGLNKELAEFLKNINKKIIIVTNATQDEIKQYVKGYDFKIFTLNKNPDKTNPEYFRELIKKFNLNINKIIYFDHSLDNVNSAKKSNILSEIYKNNKQIKKLVEKNLFIYKEAKQKNIDTGMGVERTVASLNDLNDDYLTDCFLLIIKKIEDLSGKKYNKSNEETEAMRIIADHIKASVFIIAEGIIPSNTERGYVLRRLIRRAVRYGHKLKIKSIEKIAESVFEIYDDYNLKKDKDKIIQELKKEEQKFLETLEKGLNKFQKLISQKKKLTGKDAFLLYQSFGFPLEMIEEETKKAKVKFNKKDFEREQKKHQELSRTATVGKFKSGLLNHSEKTIKLHTAAHLLLAALRIVLKDKKIIQKGSNITPERLRLDFSFPRKLTEEELKQIEDLVNEKIKESLDVVRKEMNFEEAKKLAMRSFQERYGKKVSVYIINDFSKEICAGPHVKNTRKLGNFKILKEESSSSGVRRIKATLE